MILANIMDESTVFPGSSMIMVDFVDELTKLTGSSMYLAFFMDEVMWKWVIRHGA